MNDKEQENGKTLYVGRAQKKYEREAELRARFARIKEDRNRSYRGVNLYIKNLEDDVDDERLRKEFAVYGSITSAKVSICRSSLSCAILFEKNAKTRYCFQHNWRLLCAGTW